MVAVILAACTAGRSEQTTVPEPKTPTVSPVPSRTPSPTSAPSETPAPATLQPSLTPTPAVLVCSPLQEFPLAGLAEAIVNPFQPPAPGSDDFHQGVDLGDLDPITRIALTGRPVQAVLAGRVAAVIQDRFPYGNAVLIETPLEALPASWGGAFSEPTPVASPVAVNLSCPELPDPTNAGSGRSLYTLYAHLENPPGLVIDDLVRCSDPLGAVGSSGNALNPHLHLELRVGPSAASFPGMAHYDTSASPEEMAGYCAWRVSGVFQILDPMALFDRD